MFDPGTLLTNMCWTYDIEGDGHCFENQQNSRIGLRENSFWLLAFSTLETCHALTDTWTLRLCFFVSFCVFGSFGSHLAWCDDHSLCKSHFIFCDFYFLNLSFAYQCLDSRLILFLFVSCSVYIWWAQGLAWLSLVIHVSFFPWCWCIRDLSCTHYYSDIVNVPLVFDAFHIVALGHELDCMQSTVLLVNSLQYQLLWGPVNGKLPNM